ncbi:MAG: F0F1 ATP synthase subunit B [Oscillospiraceae bacterium]|nr:F0F1 ATP synthase subunit B [Oscillospiraceae bacterium]
MGSGEFLNIDFYTALFTLLNTLVLFFVLSKLLFKPVMKIIADRQKEIDDLYADADNAKQQAQQLQAQYEGKLSEARQTGERLVKEAVARGQAREEEILQNARSEADAIMAKAEADIAREKKKAVNDAKDEIAGLAMDIAGKVVGSSLDSKDQAELVDQFIAQLGEGL